MTDTELNKSLCLKLGLPWHEQVDYYTCSCGYTILMRGEVLDIIPLHIKESNPNFTLNAKDLIEAIGLNNLERWFEFSKTIGTVIDCCVYIKLDYVTNPRLLCEAFLEWEGK